MAEGSGDEERRRRLREQPVIAVEERDGGIVVRLGGELDLYTAPKVRDALAAAVAKQPERLVLDFSEVEFIDSTGLGALVEARSRLPGRRGLSVAAPNRETRRALRISGLDRHLPVHDTVEDALAAAP